MVSRLSPSIHRPDCTSNTGPLAIDDRGMTDGACERRPHPGTNRATRDVEHVGRGGCESSACGADHIRWRLGRWAVAFAEGAFGALPHRERDSGWDIVTGPTLLLLQRLTALKDCATHNETHHGPWTLRTSVSSQRSSGDGGHAGVRESATTFVSRVDSNESVAPSLVALVEPRDGLVGRSTDRITTPYESRPPQSRVTWTRSNHLDPASQTLVCLVVCRSILQRRQALEQE
jgi:hypothetical protein